MQSTNFILRMENRIYGLVMLVRFIPVCVLRIKIPGIQRGEAEGSDTKTIERKAQEAYLAYRLEQEYSKDEILEMYMNKIYYSDGIYGIRTASLYYFDKELEELKEGSGIRLLHQREACR